jgi:hypothetical protein
MAQTKTSSARKSSSKASGTRSRSTSRNGSSTSSPRSKSTRAGTTSRNGSGSSSRSTSAASRPRSKASSTARKTASNARNRGKSAKDTVSEGAQGAVETVGNAADKVKMPLVAGSAALAGLAGAAAVAVASRSGRRRKVLGIPLPKRNGFSMPGRNGFKGDARKVASAVTDAAKRADRFGQGVSRVAGTVQVVSETADREVKKA